MRDYYLITEQRLISRYNTMYDIAFTQKLFKKAARRKRIEDKSDADFWLRYICILLDLGKIDEARDILERYLQAGQCQDKLGLYIPVACLASTLGIMNEQISLAIQAKSKLDFYRSQLYFDSLIKGKSVAIVGNGSSEIGKCLGEKIDSNDIVIRFNNFRISGYEVDYGSKTDIWVKCSSDDVRKENDTPDLRLVLYEPDYMHHPLLHGYAEEIAGSTVPVSYCDYSDHASLREKLEIFPTSGLVVLNKVLQANPSDVHCYGFSFRKDVPDLHCTHYFDDRDESESIRRSSHHNIKKEAIYIKRILKQKYGHN